ncbi:MAG TPA: cyclic pyranopterin monophosphate synthase MoaC [Steroidobacteraceae bacterium]|nr:cyclic pyranopterin monophosphate synthase MoaC [Steroidobacteraceae bacterium]
MPKRSAKPRLSHLDAARRPTMVGVGAKQVTHRIAEAEARLALPAAVARALRASGHRSAKGPVFDTAIIAGVQAVKRTAEIIPFCHPLPIEDCSIAIARMAGNQLRVRCRVETHHKTGVEMEALTGATVAALTIYDMCKALSHAIRIVDVRLIHKSGGRRVVGRSR